MRSQNSSTFPANFLQSMFLSVTCYWLIDWLVFNVQRAIFQLYSGRVTCYDFPIKTMFGSSLPPVVCWRAHVLFTLFVFVCVKWCPAHIVLYYCFVFLHIVYPVLPVSLDCTFLIAPSVFSNVYWNTYLTFWGCSTIGAIYLAFVSIQQLAVLNPNIFNINWWSFIWIYSKTGLQVYPVSVIVP